MKHVDRPVGATHYNEPWYYRVVGKRVEFFSTGKWVPSLWSLKDIRTHEDFTKLPPLPVPPGPTVTEFEFIATLVDGATCGPFITCGSGGVFTKAFEQWNEFRKGTFVIELHVTQVEVPES